MYIYIFIWEIPEPFKKSIPSHQIHPSFTAPGIKVMVSRMTLILYILQCKDVFWVYEQPTSSLLWHHPRMESFIRAQDAFRTFTWMGSYGADSPKGTTLWGSKPGVKKLARNLPQKQWCAEMTKQSTLSNGKLSISGGRDLKKSQAYTAQFGLATLATWLEETFQTYDPKLLENANIPALWAPIPKKDRWEDARLLEVFQFLSLN